MFSQVGAGAAATQRDVARSAPCEPRRLIAIGESQSAFRLVTYVNAVHPVAQVYDGFLIHSRGGGGAPLSQAPQPAIVVPTPALIRDDIDVPVLTFETETDLISLGYFPARQPDVRHFRAWEVAGTAHDDAYGLVGGPRRRRRRRARHHYLPPVSSIFGVITCGAPINAGPQHYVVSAALRRLDRWVRSGGQRAARTRRGSRYRPARPPRSSATRTATRSAASARRRSTCRSPRSPASARPAAASAASSARPCPSTPRRWRRSTRATRLRVGGAEGDDARGACRLPASARREAHEGGRRRVGHRRLSRRNRQRQSATSVIGTATSWFVIGGHPEAYVDPDDGGVGDVVCAQRSVVESPMFGTLPIVR